MPDLFAADDPAPTPARHPDGRDSLAERLRPTGLDEVIGQEHLTGPNGAIGRMVAAGSLSSMILWGPPGTGKTSIARFWLRQSACAMPQSARSFPALRT
jgi:putative ATPase